jgi:hypothetical protein
MATLNLAPMPLDIRRIPFGNAVIFSLALSDAPQEGDIYEAVVYKGNTTTAADVTVEGSSVTCLWGVDEINAIGCGVHKWRFTRIRDSLPRDLCNGKFEVRSRV